MNQAVNSSIMPELAGLDQLGRRDGVDTRPTLVRVLTDLYVQKSAHTSEEERHYTELVLRLVDAVDVKTRAMVAAKLATYPAAPPAIVRRLARDVIEVAEPLLRGAAALSGPDLLAIIKDFGVQHAAAIADRNEPQLAATVEPVEREMTGSPVASAECAGATASAPSEMLVQLHLDRLASGLTLGELFLSAGSAERRVLIANLADADAEVAGESATLPEADTIRKLEAAALERNPALFARELEHALGVSQTLARRIVGDDSGEPLLVAARAMGIPSDVLLRFLLFLNPAVGQSVQRVFDLARLYERIAPDAARTLMASLRHREPRPLRAPVHRPLHWDDEADRGRGGSALAARRAPETPERSGEPSRQPEPARLVPAQRTM